MTVDCLYRLYPYGEMQHGKFKTISGTIQGIPEWMFKGNIDPDLWSPANYSKSGHAYNIGHLEYVLVNNRDCYMCIENNNMGMFVCFNNGCVKYSYGEKDQFANVTYWDMNGFQGKFKEIGFKATKVRQVSTEVRPGSIAVCLKDGLIYSNGTTYRADFDISKCDAIKTNYAGYKDAVLNGDYGVIYYDGGVYVAEQFDIKDLKRMRLGRRLQ